MGAGGSGRLVEQAVKGAEIVSVSKVVAANCRKLPFMLPLPLLMGRPRGLLRYLGGVPRRLGELQARELGAGACRILTGIHGHAVPVPQGHAHAHKGGRHEARGRPKNHAMPHKRRKAAVKQRSLLRAQPRP